MYRGQVVYIYAFDIAYDMKRDRLLNVLGQPVKEYSVGPTKRNPKQLFFYRPQMVNFKPEQKQGPSGVIQVQKMLKIFNIGAISIQLRVPFEVDLIEQLVGFYNLVLNNKTVESDVRQLAEQVRKELEPYCIRPAAQLSHIEEYTVFCLQAIPAGADGSVSHAEDWFIAHRRPIAALLTEEAEPNALSEQEVAESTEKYLSYYNSDLAVVDWDAALVLGEQDNLDDVLHIIELANVQLLELAAYDRILDGSLEMAYRDLSKRRLRPRRDVHRNLREIHVDLARLSDELLNITKFFGDWHLARIYQQLSIRFHLADWRSIIQEKLKALGELYQLLQQDWVNFWMVLLEATIVLLFIVDVFLLLIGL